MFSVKNNVLRNCACDREFSTTEIEYIMVNIINRLPLDCDGLYGGMQTEREKYLTKEYVCFKKICEDKAKTSEPVVNRFKYFCRLLKKHAKKCVIF